MCRILGFLILCVFAAVPSIVQAQSMPTNSGTDFLLCFEQNDAADSSSTDSGLCELYLANLSDSTSDTVIIHCRHYPSGEIVVVLSPPRSRANGSRMPGPACGWAH